MSLLRASWAVVMLFTGFAACSTQSPKTVEVLKVNEARQQEFQSKVFGIFYSKNKPGPTSLPARIEAASEALLSADYVMSPLGEGSEGKIDADPLLRWDAFDCTTYVETVMALALAQSKDELLPILNRIRYSGDLIRFEDRNHFPELDWMPHNIQKGFVQDVTESLNLGKVKVAQKSINKKRWFGELHPSVASSAVQNKFETETASIKYLPLSNFIVQTGNGYEMSARLSRIPSGIFFNFVVLKSSIENTSGLEPLVKHQGIFIWKNNELIARHASPRAKKVVDVPAFDFILQHELQAKQGFDGERGFNLFQLNDRKDFKAL